MKPPAVLRFKVDENLPQELVDMLRGNGHEAQSVNDQGLGGVFDDRIAEVCRAESRIVVTLDVDFADVRRYAPSRQAGIIVFRVAHQEKRHLMGVFARVVELLQKESVAGRLWVVSEWGVRVRGGEA